MLEMIIEGRDSNNILLMMRMKMNVLVFLGSIVGVVDGYLSSHLNMKMVLALVLVLVLVTVAFVFAHRLVVVVGYLLSSFSLISLFVYFGICGFYREIRMKRESEWETDGVLCRKERK